MLAFLVLFTSMIISLLTKISYEYMCTCLSCIIYFGQLEIYLTYYELPKNFK